ncbi:MAG: hypothetical protein KDD02_04240 [Phaeodactylibacter sp.]|nr:hypothetical protein [Phaeodactylibacter sp.]MCB9303607.1 hypothetical protein [Lewinellaceae bacterium]
MIFVEVFADYREISPNGDSLELYGRIEATQYKETVVEYGFVWSTVDSSTFPGLEIEKNLVRSNNLSAANGKFFCEIAVRELMLDTVYYFWAYAITKEGDLKYSSSPLVFNTGDILIITGEIKPFLLTFCTFEGELQGLAIDRIKEHGHIWVTTRKLPGETTLVIERDSSRRGPPHNSGIFSTIITTLLPNITYEVQAYAQTDDTIFYGDPKMITTKTIQLSDVKLEQTGNEIIAKGEISQLSFLNIITPDSVGYKYAAEYGFFWNNAEFPQDLPDWKVDHRIVVDSNQTTNTTFDSCLTTLGPGENWINAWAYAILERDDGVYSDTLFSSREEGYFYLEEFWKETSTLLPTRSGAVAFVLGELAYIGLGETGEAPPEYLSDFHSFNGTGWASVGGFPGGPRSSAVSFVIEDTAYVGLGNTSDVLFYKYTFSGWDAEHPVVGFPGVGLRGAVAFVINDTAYVGLGRKATGGGLSNEFYKYNPVSGWEASQREFPGQPRSGAIAFVLDDTIAHVGLGEGVNNKILRYTPNQGWETFGINFGNETEGRFGAIVFVIDDVAFIGLGQSNNDLAYKHDLWGFPNNTIINNTFPFAQNPQGRTDAIGFRIDGKGYVGAGKYTTPMGQTYWFGDFFQFNP